MDGKFFINDNSYLKVEDIDKHNMVCLFGSLLNYRICGDKDHPDFIDPSGGPRMDVGSFKINEFTLKEIKNTEDGYKFYFTR